MNVNPKSDQLVRILLVEDNPGDARLITTLLSEFETREFSVEVHVAQDGELALDFLFHRGIYTDSPKPDVVVLDLNLPKKNGFEVLSEMRRKPSFQSTPVFVLTTSNTHRDILKSYASGAVSFITKPSQFEEFQDVIKRFLSVELPRVLRNSGRILK